MKLHSATNIQIVLVSIGMRATNTRTLPMPIAGLKVGSRATGKESLTEAGMPLSGAVVAMGTVHLRAVLDLLKPFSVMIMLSGSGYRNDQLPNQPELLLQQTLEM